MPTDSASAVNPLVPFSDTVTTPTAEGDETGLSTPPVGLNDAFPLQFSPQAWALMNPQQQFDMLGDLLTNSDDDGNFNPKAKLDPSQVEWGSPLPSTPPDWAPTPPGLPTPSTRPPQQGVDGIPMPGSDKGPDPDPESRFDDIGYRVSELFKGHWQNFLNPDRYLPPEGIPVTSEQIGAPATGAQAQRPHALKAPSGDNGFYSADPSKWKYVSDDPTRVQAILNVANSMVGNSAAPADLVRRAYAEAGIELPTIPDFQMNWGDRVPLNELKPGDLVAWSGDGGYQNMGIMLLDGKAIKAPAFGEGPRVFDLYNVPRNNIFGTRIQNNNGGGGHSVTLTASSFAAQSAASAAVNAIKNVLGGLFGDMNHNGGKKKDENKGGGKGGGGGKPSGQGSKYYGSDQDNTNNSSHHYTGIGATK